MSEIFAWGEGVESFPAFPELKQFLGELPPRLRERDGVSASVAEVLGFTLTVHDDFPETQEFLVVEGNELEFTLLSKAGEWIRLDRQTSDTRVMTRAEFIREELVAEYCVDLHREIGHAERAKGLGIGHFQDVVWQQWDVPREAAFDVFEGALRFDAAWEPENLEAALAAAVAEFYDVAAR